MDDKIKEYILAQTEFDAPEVQEKFKLTYVEMQSILKKLEEAKKIVYVSGVKYKTQETEISSDSVSCQCIGVPSEPVKSRRQMIAQAVYKRLREKYEHEDDDSEDYSEDDTLSFDDDDDFFSLIDDDAFADDEEDYDSEDDFDADDEEEDDDDDEDEDDEDEESEEEYDFGDDDEIEEAGEEGIATWRDSLQFDKHVLESPPRGFGRDSDKHTFDGFTAIEEAMLTAIQNSEKESSEKGDGKRTAIAIRNMFLESVVRLVRGSCENGIYKIWLGRTDIEFKLNLGGYKMRLTDKNTLKNKTVTEDRKKAIAKLFDGVVIDTQKKQIYVDVIRPIQCVDAIMKLYFVARMLDD